MAESRTPSLNTNNTNIKLDSILSPPEPPQPIQEPIIEPPQPTNKDIEDKRKRLMTLNAYKQSPRFGTWLQKDMNINLKPDHLNNLTIQELDLVIHDIRVTVASKGSSSIGNMVASQGSILIESLVNPLYKIEGFSKVLMQNPQFLDSLEELMLEYQQFNYLKPQYRIVIEVLKTMLTVHYSHKFLEDLSKTKEGQEIIKKQSQAIENAPIQNIITDIIQPSISKQEPIKSNEMLIE